ncbi:hypothetical protein QTP88_020893 [Uroleucon formosanum]
MASKRKALCVDQKVALICAIEKGEKKSDVGKRFGFSQSTVATIWKNKDKILHAETEGSSCKKIRKPKFEDLDQAMLTWFHKQRFTYKANKSAWMTSILFEEEIRKWDAELKGRKVLLLVDNCPAHPNLSNLMNIEMIFFPANTTSILQPMDQSVIKISTKIDVDQNISISITTATNTNIVNIDDDSITNNTTSGHLDLSDLNSGPMRPILKVFPKTKFGQQNRSFSCAHYKKCPWIEYSIKNDAIFCYACRLFSKDSGHVEQTFISIGFNNWKKLSGYRDSKVNCTKLELHNSCIHHLTAMSKWSGHNSMQKNEFVHNKILIEITLFLSKQGIAFRGHRENEFSINRGNFKETCQMVAKFDEIFANHFYSKTNYTNWSVQNTIIDECAKKMNDFICNEIKECGVFSVMVDEARSFNEEQLPFCIRYTNNLDVVGRFLTFLNVSEKQDADSLSTIMFNYLDAMALSIPVSSATCERSFSTMRRIKNWLRTSMNQELFSSLAIINMERHVSNQLKAEDILIDYAKTNKRFFSLKQKNDTENMFISTGYTNWKNAMSSRGFLRHDNSDEHKNCTISWIEFKKNKLNKTSVLSQLNNHHASIVTENKKYMEAIIISLRMLAIQGIAFRGHIENESSINQGNFLELMKVISLFDNVVKKKMNGPKNARYLHHSIQKELIHIMASMIINKISSELEKSMYFAIMIDETKDITKTKQLSVVVRYYYNNEIKERFLGFTPLKNLDANALFNHIQVKLNKCKIDINKCVAQTYDGTNVMRGSINGVQALFKNKVPHAFYIHCHNHRLNLVLVDVAKNVDEVNFFFNFLQDLYNFISGSSIHSKFIELQKQIFKIPKPIELKRLCLTRWSSQIHTCRAVKATLEVILLLLYKISNEKSIRSSEAIGLLKNIDFKFIYLLLFFNDLLSQINLLTKYLQDKNADMAKAIILMNSLKEHFCEIRNDLNYHSKLYSETKLIANKLNIKHPSAHNREKNRVKKLPKHLQKYIVEGNSLESSVLSSETDFRNNLYLIIIDKINAELNKRFSNNEDLLMGISVLDPSNSNFLDKKLIHPFALSYMCDIDTLDSELNIIRKSLKQFEAKYHSIKTIFQFHKFLLDYQLAFFELYKLLTIAITIPVSSAACERTFSCMKRIKSYLRNSMLHDNLSSLSIIAIEKSEAKLLNIDDIINNFAECHNNRRIILK